MLDKLACLQQQRLGEQQEQHQAAEIPCQPALNEQANVEQRQALETEQQKECPGQVTPAKQQVQQMAYSTPLGFKNEVEVYIDRKKALGYESSR